MITLLTGEDSFEIDRELQRIETEFDGAAEKIDGSELDVKQLPDLLMGTSLFAEQRLVIMKNLSENKSVWPDFVDWLERASDDIQLVIVDAKPDKRTRTYKELQKIAEVKEFKPWGERDGRLAEQWAVEEAKRMGLGLSADLAKKLVQRTGVDQWRLWHGLEKLALSPTITPGLIDDVIEVSPSENVFELFATALNGDVAKLHNMLQTLERTEDVHKVMGLLSSQGFQLLALAAGGDKPSGEVAKDLGAHPFVLSKLAPMARREGTGGAKKIVRALILADERMKRTSLRPWTVLENALLQIAAR